MASLQFASGTTLADYRIDALIGRGGMGVVYRATQLALERTVALKVIAPEASADERFRERFQREARIAASLDHPNVLPIYEAGEAEGLLFVTMRYVAGGDLGALLEDGPLAAERAIALVAQVADALDAAHERGLIHRDVKPSNILLEERGGTERAYLADFGLAKVSASQSDLTKTGVLVGTLDYIPPEQIRGEPLDPRSDVYALGCLLYQALTGQVPYRSEDELAKLWAHMHEPPPSASGRVSGAAELDEVVRHAMAKQPDDRYHSAGALRQAAFAALERRQSVERGLVRRAPRTRGVLQHLGQRSLLVLFAAVVLLLLAAFGTAQLVEVFSRGGGDARPTTGRTANEAGTVVGRPIAVFEDVAHVAVTDDAVWVANQASNTSNAGRVAHIDPRLNEVVGLPIQLPAAAGGVAIAHGSVWVAGGRSLTRIDATTGGVDAVIRVPGATGVAASGSAIWVLGTPTGRPPPGGGPMRGALLRIDPKNNRPVGEPIPVGRESSRVAVGEGAVWVLNNFDGTVTRIDPATNTVVGKPIPATPGEGGGDMVVGEGVVWVADLFGGAVVRIDPDSHQVVGSPITGPWKDPLGLALSDGALWVTDVFRGTVSRVDIDSGAVVGTPIRVGSAPLDVAVGDGAVWVANSADGTVTRIAPTP